VLVVSPFLSQAPQALFVSYTAVLGGAERLLIERAVALPGPVALACPDGDLAERAREAGIVVVPLRPRRMELRSGARDRLAAPLRLAAQSREVRRAIVALDPRTVIGWNMRGLLTAVAAMAGTRPGRPLVFAHNELLPSPLVARTVRAAARRADAVVALSRTIAADLDPDGRLDGRVTVLHGGVDLQRFRPAPFPGRPVALVLGAVVGWKRPGLGLEAAARVPGLNVRVVGAPLGDAGARLLEELRHRAARPDLAGRAEVTGESEDAAGALAGATVLLHCADREPFGLVVAEALAAGRPVVAPRGGGPAEIVDDTCGALYAPGDAAAAAKALTGVLGRAEVLGRNARTRAEASLDARATGARFAELIEELS
jgi:glycosyltransferase involved in cell wall biosynthesis